jgi:hypothetical protein
MFKVFLMHFLGYKARTHIAKALQRRCAAIRNAVKEYNSAAGDLTPPRPTVDWSAVSTGNFLEEFEFLRDPRRDQIQTKAWAQPVMKTLMRYSQRIAQARIEVKHCNIEVRRIHTSIRDEEQVFVDIVDGSIATSFFASTKFTRSMDSREHLRLVSGKAHLPPLPPLTLTQTIPGWIRKMTVMRMTLCQTTRLLLGTLIE